MDTSLPEEKSTPTDTTPTREFTVNDVIKICSDVADKENIVVQLAPRKQSLFRRFSEDFSKLSVKNRSANNSDSDLDSCDVSPVISPAKRASISKAGRMEVVTDSKIVKDTETPKDENIPGLAGRDVVAIAILVDHEGVPMKTYTEHEDIPSEEYDAANQVYISRVPSSADNIINPKLKSSVSSSNGLSGKALSDVLAEDIDVEKANKLKKRMMKILIKLHTTDLTTAQSFLKLERFAKVRNEIAIELLNFVEKDLKMAILHEFDDE